jgi:hypothetical protein
MRTNKPMAVDHPEFAAVLPLCIHSHTKDATRAVVWGWFVGGAGMVIVF